MKRSVNTTNNSRVTSRGYVAQVLRDICACPTAAASDGAIVTKALAATSGLPTPYREETFLKLVVDELEMRHEQDQRVSLVVNG